MSGRVYLLLLLDCLSINYWVRQFSFAMNDNANDGSEATSAELAKPVQPSDDVKFPPFPGTPFSV